MATMVGRLAATLSLNSTAFSKGLKTATGGLNSFRGMVTGVHAKLAGLFATVAGVGFTALIKQSAETIDVQNKLARELGLTTERLIGLQHGAGLAGASAEDLTTGIRKLLLNMEKAGLTGMTTGDALETVADRIAAIEDPAQRARMAYDVFGKSGQKLIEFLSGGSAAMRAAEADARKLGIAFNAVDGQQVEAANDAFARMGLVLKGVTNRLAIELAPLVELSANKLTDMGTAGVGASGLVAEGMEKLRDVLADVGDGIDTIKIKFKQAQLEAAKWSKGPAQWFSWEGHKSKAQGGDPEAFADSFERSIERMENELNQQLVKTSTGTRIRQFFDGIQARADKLRETLGKPIPVNIGGAGMQSVKDQMDKAIGGKAVDRGLIPFANPQALLRGSSEAFGRILERSGPPKNAGLTPDAKSLGAKLDKMAELLREFLRSQTDTGDSVVTIP